MPRTPLLGRESLNGSHSPRLLTALAVGSALAGTALFVRRSARRAERRHPPAGCFITVDNVRLHYLESGEGHPVVLLHGNGVTARDFVASGLFGKLAQHYHVLAFDRPGFGYSERPRSRVWTPDAQAKLLHGATASLGIDRPVVVGHSWGAMVALSLALHDPDALRGLLLISGYYYPTPRIDSLWQSPPAIPLVGDVMRYTVSPLLGRLITPLLTRKMFAPRPVPGVFRQEVPLEMMLRPWQLRAAAADSAMMVPAAAALSRHYGQIHPPLALVTGTEDRVVDFSAHSVRLHHEVPHSKLLTVSTTGHMAHYAIPERLAQAVDDLFSAYDSQTVGASTNPEPAQMAPVGSASTFSSGS